MCLKSFFSQNPANSVFHWEDAWRLQATQPLMRFQGIYCLLDKIYPLHLVFAQVMLVCSFSGINHFLQQVNLHSFCLLTLCSEDPISKNRFLSFYCRGFGMLVSLSLESPFSFNCHSIPFISHAYCFLLMLETRRIEEFAWKEAL
jgi:hypothetical protein